MFQSIVNKLKPVYEQICILRLRVTFFNISMIGMYAPTEEAEGEGKVLPKI